MAYPSPLLRTNFYVNKRKVSNKYNYTKFFLKKIQFQIQRLSVLVYAFVAIAEKFPFLLTSSLAKPLSPHVRKCQHFINPLPPRVLTSYVNGPLHLWQIWNLLNFFRRYSVFRKPRPGTWEYLEKYKNGGIPIDLSRSFYCGDAAGSIL